MAANRFALPNVLNIEEVYSSKSAGLAGKSSYHECKGVFLMADSKERDALVEEVEAQASLYALGALPAEDTARFRQRLQSGCPFCIHQVSESDQAVKALAISAPEAAAPPQARERLLESLGVAQPPPGILPMGPGKLVRAGGTAWQSSPVPGVEVRNLHEDQTMLVRMAPKTVFPSHNHHAGEHCLVLEGSVSSDGLTAYAGDFTYMPAGSEHHPLYTETGCLLLIAYS